MRLLVDVLVELILCNRHGVVSTELLQAVQARRQSKHNEGVLLFNACNVFVLFFLFLVPAVQGEYNDENNAQSTENSGNGYNGIC